MVFAILRALATVLRRDLAGFAPLRTNNFFLFVALLIWGALVSGVKPVSSYPFLALLALLLFFPISSDPLDKVPAVRLALWPLPARARVVLRCAALALNPLLWLTIPLLIREGRRALFPLAALAATVAIRTRAPRTVPHFAIGRLVPPLPGSTGILLANSLRQMLTVLDTWLALVIALIATGWRVTTLHPDRAAAPILSILVGIALSTQTQCAVGLDATRYHILPVTPLRILLARDLAYLAVQLLLTAALDPVAGLAFGFAAVALGRYPSLFANLQAERWRFTGGRVLFGSLQMIVGAALVFGGLPGILIGAILWTGSLFYGASVLAQRLHGIDAAGAPRG